MGFRDLFESKEAREARLETEKFNLCFKLLSTKLREVERELNKATGFADKFYQEASTYRAAGNKEQALTSYKQFLVSIKLRQTLSKSWQITYQATVLMKMNSLTNEDLGLQNEGMKNTQLEPANPASPAGPATPDRPEESDSGEASATIA